MFVPNTVASQVSKYMANAVTVSSIWGDIIFNVKAYGAKGDGVTDDTAAIQAAITAAVANGGGVVFFPPGTYIVSGNLTKITTSGIYFEGSGPYATIIKHTSDTQNFLQFGDEALGTSGTIKGVGISDLSIEHNSTRSAGFTIANVNAQEIKIKNLRIKNSFYMFQIGSSTDTQGIFVVIEDVIGECVGNGVAFNFLGGVNGIHLLHVQVNNENAGTAIRIVTGANGLDTLYMDDCLFQRFNFGMNINGSTGTIQNAFIAKTVFDGTQFASLNIGPTASCIVTRFHFVECWFTSDLADAVVIDAGTEGNVDGIYFSGSCRWNNVQNRGLVLNSGKAINISLDDCILSGCSMAGVGLSPAIETGAGCKKFYIKDCVIGQEGQTPTNQAYGVKTGLNNDLYQIMDNVMLGNVTAAISDAGGTFTNKLIKDNLGYNPVGAVTAPAMPASAVEQKNNFSFPVQVYIFLGTVNGIAKNGIGINGMTSGLVVLYPGETISITYTAAPSWTWFGL